MNVSAEILEGNMAKLTIEVPAETFEVSMDKAYRQMANKVSVHGFRKGKAPRQVVERLYGREILLEDAINDAIPQAFSQAMEELGRPYECIVYPTYDVVSSEKGEGLLFTATYDLKPAITLGEYKKMEVERLPETYDEADVESQLTAMRERFAKLETVDGPAAMGDICSIDFLGKIDDEPFEGGQGKDYALELGSNTFIPGFEEQLVGAKAGDALDVQVTFPEDYHAEALAGKDAVFEVAVHEVQHKILAEMNDEFAMDVSEYETIADLRKSIEDKLQADAKEKAQSDFESKAVAKAVEEATFAMPESMITLRKDQLVDNFANQITRQGLALDTYLQYTQMTVEDLRDNFKDRAEQELRTELVLEAIAEAEGIAAEEADIAEEYARLATQTGGTAEDIEKIYLANATMLESLKFSLMMNKTIKLIADHATAVAPSETPAEAQEGAQAQAADEETTETKTKQAKTTGAKTTKTKAAKAKAETTKPETTETETEATETVTTETVTTETVTTEEA